MIPMKIYKVNILSRKTKLIFLILKLNSIFLPFLKANHSAYIDPRWYGSRISTDCQQNLLSPKHDTSGRFLLVNFLKEQKREDDTQRRQR